jgi:ABC-type bacteriocin/lantibiotic exporter with double-glycine peptidase domain
MAALILQFYHPQSGSIYFDGLDADEYALTDIRNQVAIVPQDVLLFGGTIMENIAYGKLGSQARRNYTGSQKSQCRSVYYLLPRRLRYRCRRTRRKTIRRATPAYSYCPCVT